MERISVLSRPVENIFGVFGVNHTALGVGDNVVEVTGSAIGQPQEIRTSPRSQHRFTTEHYLGMARPEDVQKIALEWKQAKSRYNLSDANCQAFVIHAAEELGYDPQIANQGELLISVQNALRKIRSPIRAEVFFSSPRPPHVCQEIGSKRTRRNSISAA